MLRFDEAQGPPLAEGDVEPPQRPLGRWLLLANLGVAAALLALAWVTLASARSDAEHRARVATENLAATLQQTVGGEVAQTDRALRSAAAVARRADDAALAAILAEQIGYTPELLRLAVVGPDGAERQGVGPAALDGLGQRGFFRHLRDEGGDALVVSAPEPAAGGRWVVVLARRIGATDGIAVAVLPVEHFAHILASVDLGPQGAASLRGSDLRLIARHALNGDVNAGIGGSQVSPELARAIAAGPQGGSYVARTLIDGVERSNAYRRVDGYPLWVTVGLGTADYLTAWRRQAALVAALAALVLVIVGGASWLVARGWRREADAARALRAAGRRNRALLLMAGDGIHVVDREGRLVGLNQAFAEMLGESREALIGRHASHWDVHFSPQQIADGLAAHHVGRRHRFETRHRRADGQEIDVEVHSVGVRVDGRDLIFCAARDITQRKRLEAELAAAAAEMRDLYDHAPCGYHSLDADGLFVHINETELGWLGASRDEIVGKKRIGEFLTPEGRAAFEREFPRLFEGGRVEGLEIDLPGVGGGLRRVSVSATAVRDADGRFLRSRSVLYDISELHRTREELCRLAREQQAMLDNDLVGIAKTRGGVVVWANRAMERLFGWRRDELIGRSARSFYADAQAAEEFRLASQAAFERDGRYRAHVENLRRDGSRIWIDANGLPLPADETLWLLADITAIKQSQAQAEHLAFHDSLTGLPNRLLLADRLRQALAAAERGARRVAVCYLDLDGFKPVNDAFGHDAGDRLLREVAARLQRCVRANDTVARVGGDEFVLLLTELDDSGGHDAVLARVALEVARPVMLDEQRSAQVGVSVGVAIFPDDARDGDALLLRADLAMYASKRGGIAPADLSAAA